MKSVHVRGDLHRQLEVISAEEGIPLIDVLERLVTVGLKGYRRQRRAEEGVRSLVSSLRTKMSALPTAISTLTPSTNASSWRPLRDWPPISRL